MYRYTLRFSLVPTRDFEERMEKLLAFCEEAEIDDVMFFIAPEELSLGHITKEEAKAWVEAIVRAKKILDEKGILVSLNPWVTLNHYDGGRKLKKGQNFRTMVGMDGTKTEAVVCPLCENWRKYYADLLRYYVDEISPDVLWLEDDLRLSNHEPVGYGCFCDEHVRLLNEKLGTAYTQAELSEKILDDAKVRNAFIDLSRETIEDTISYIIENVPNQKTFGIMTSGASSTLREGRRHSRLYSILAKNGGKPYNRIHLGAYRQMGLQEYAWGINSSAMWHRILSPNSAHFVSELESYPHTTYTKSANFTRFQLMTSMPVCLDGATLSIFEFNGNGIVDGAGYAKVLKESKPFLSKFNDLKLKPALMRGVYVLYSENSAYTIKAKTRSWGAYCPQDSWWFAYLEQLGVACTYGSDVTVKGQVVALSGQVVRNYTKEELTALFANNFVLVNAECAEILIEMGLGSLLRASACEWWQERTGKYTFEQVATGEEVCGEKELRATAQFFCGDYLHLTYTDEDREVYTKLYDYHEEAVADGIVRVGNVLVFPHRGKSVDFPIPISLLHPVREYAIKKAIDEHAPNKEDMFFVQQQNVCPYVFKKEGRTYILLVNFSDDEYRRFDFRCGEEYDRIRIITPEAPKEKTIGFEYEQGNYWSWQKIPPQSCILLACDWVDPLDEEDEF